jgi:hypothetical protein
VGEGADGQVVHAGAGHLPGVLQPQAAAGLQLGVRVGAGYGDRGTHLVQAHVVQQDQRGSRSQGLADLAEGVALYLDHHAGRGG